MFRTLVVPLDGSPLAEQALPYAMRLAHANKGRLVLVRAALAPVQDGIDGVNWEQDQLAAVAEAERYLAAVATDLAGQVDVDTAVTYGRAAPQILEDIAAFNADAVVMATHGRTGLPHLLVGSVAEAILSKSPAPVFLVHAAPNAPPPPAFDPMAARLLVPLDGSSFAEQALQPALQFLGPAGELVLMCVIYPPEHVITDPSRRHVVAYLDQQEEAQTRDAHEYLTKVANKLRTSNADIHVSIDTRIAAHAGNGIVRSATERAANLVVMATHGRTGVRRAVLGSVAGYVLRTGKTPLLLVGPSANVEPLVPVPDVAAVS